MNLCTQQQQRHGKQVQVNVAPRERSQTYSVTSLDDVGYQGHTSIHPPSLHHLHTQTTTTHRLHALPTRPTSLPFYHPSSFNPPTITRPLPLHSPSRTVPKKSNLARFPKMENKEAPSNDRMQDILTPGEQRLINCAILCNPEAFNAVKVRLSPPLLPLRPRPTGRPATLASVLGSNEIPFHHRHMSH